MRKHKIRMLIALICAAILVALLSSCAATQTGSLLDSCRKLCGKQGTIGVQTSVGPDVVEVDCDCRQ
jgi:hypothetical protein